MNKRIATGIGRLKFPFYILIFILGIVWPASQSRDQLGDMNGDGIINVQDIIRVLNIILGYEPEPTEYELWAGDVNADDQINIQDVIIMVEQILQTWDCPDWHSPCTDDLSQCCQDTTKRFTNIVIDTIGEFQSTLLDATIVNEDDIWAVDHIVLPDSLQYYFNTAHWNGTEWEYFNSFGPGDVYSIFAFTQNDIWAGINRPIRYDGNDWIGYLPEDGWEDGWNFVGEITCIWGSSSEDVYFTGRSGSIAHYDGETFHFTPWDTDIDMRDIAGTPDGEYVFASGWSWDWPGSSLVLMHNDNHWHEIYYSEGGLPSDSTYGLAGAIDVFGDTLYVATLAGLWKYNFMNYTSVFIPVEDMNYQEVVFKDMIVQSPIDVLLFPGYPAYIHFNGSSWQVNDDVIQYFGEGGAWTLGGDMKGDMFVSVGYIYNAIHALSVRGYR